MGDFSGIYLFNLAAILLFMCCVWLVSLRLKDASIMDIIWGPGFVLVVWLTFIRAGGAECSGLLAAFLVTIWGLRLGIHIGRRNIG